MAVHSDRVPSVPVKTRVAVNAQHKKKHALDDMEPVKKTGICITNWRHLLALVSDGMFVRDALKEADVSQYTLEGTLRTDEKAKAQWEDAKTTALQRVWDLETLEDIMAFIAAGGTVNAAIREYATDEVKSAELSFYKLLLRDPIIKELYDEARMIQAEKMAIDDVITISDDTQNDETFDGRPNSAAVNRARLKVQSRQWIAGRLNFKRFGDKRHVDLDATIIVDHAARLEEARRRKDKLNKSKKVSADEGNGKPPIEHDPD